MMSVYRLEVEIKRGEGGRDSQGGDKSWKDMTITL